MEALRMKFLNWFSGKSDHQVDPVYDFLRNTSSRDRKKAYKDILTAVQKDQEKIIKKAQTAK